MNDRIERLPRWAEIGREQWTHRGARRPSFADPVGAGQESVWDYPRPACAVADPRRVVVQVGGVEIAATTDAIRVLETSHPPSFYLPRSSVAPDALRPTTHTTRCEWKGVATYFDVVGGDIVAACAAWSYEAPFDEMAVLAGYVSFYPSRVDCFVDGHRVVPQHGGFYGGWITPEIVGPFKGAPGTSGW